MGIIVLYIRWVCSFFCVEGNELVLEVAWEYGLKIFVGAWFSDDKDLNEQEIEGLICQVKVGYVDIVVVGNEVMYCKEFIEDELLEYIVCVRVVLLDEILVGYVDVYYEFSVWLRIIEVCDVILANCYFYWEGCYIDYSFIYVCQMYYQALYVGQGKRVIIIEMGWLSQGIGLGDVEFFFINVLCYFLNIQQWMMVE